MTGQARIAETEGDVLQVRLEPDCPPAVPEAVASIIEADYLIFGPGSWFTSVVPHLLVPDLVTAILASPAKRICLMNLRPVGETNGFTPARHIEVLAEHCPQLTLDTVVVDPRFAAGDPHLEQMVQSMRGQLMVSDVGMRDGSARHDPFLLAATLSVVMEL